MDVFVKLFTLQCSLLSESMNYDYAMNLNLIFMEVPSTNLGYEGLNWWSDQNNNFQILHDYANQQSINVRSGLDPDRMLFQNFAKDNIVFYYQKPQYNESYITSIIQEQFENFKQDYSIHIRLYFADPKYGVDLQTLIDSYWEGKNKTIVFSGTIPRFDELELFNIVNNILLWNDSPEVNDWFPGFKSSKIIEFKNEFLELLKMPRGKDFFVYLYSDDCPVCDSNKEFYDDLAE